MRRCQLDHFAEIQRAQFVVKNEQCKGQEHVTYTGYHEGFHRGSAILRIGVVEADQQIGAEAHAFPTQVHQQQVIAQHQHHHARDEQVGVGEEARITFFAAHVPGCVHVDQETNASDH